MIFAANWKMNLSVDEAVNLAKAYAEAGFPDRHQVVVLASDLALHDVAEVFVAYPSLEVYSQDVSIFNGYGSFTGEQSAHSIKDAGGKGCLIGHMERRTHLAENDNEINMKIKNALKSELKVILSVGVTTTGLSASEQKQMIETQLQSDLFELTPEQLEGKLIVAFESVETISSFGNSASGDKLPLTEILEKITIIRDWFSKNYPELAVPLLYGGSVAPENISQFTDSESFDGFLVGKKSLDVAEFQKLLEAV